MEFEYQHIKITITPEKFLNNPCPEITDEMLDWLFDTLWSTRYYLHGVRKIDSIHIRANQAFEGCSNLHFYISFNNDKHEFHKTWNMNSKLSHQSPYFSYSGSWLCRKQRWEWLIHAVNNGVDCGVDGIRACELITNARVNRQKLEAEKKEISQQAHSYNMYLNAKRKYEPELFEDDKSVYIVNNEMIKSIVSSLCTDDKNCKIETSDFDEYEEHENDMLERLIKEIHQMCPQKFKGWYEITHKKLTCAVSNTIEYFRLELDKVHVEYVNEFYQHKNIIYHD